MKLGEFFIPWILTESANRRNRGHWGRQYRKDVKLRQQASILLSCYMPKDLIVSAPHARRKVSLEVRRHDLLDWDNLVAGLKPFVDVLRCRRIRGIVSWEGIVWDDSPEYLDLEVEQVKVDKDALVGIHVEVT